MASGAIIGECPICGELVWEDDWDLTNNITHHKDCKMNQYISIFSKLSIDEQKRVLECAGISRGGEDECVNAESVKGKLVNAKTAGKTQGAITFTSMDVVG